jgi:hypothetical protein
MQPLGDAVQCSQTVRALRWPAGVACPSWASPQGSTRGGDDTEPAWQRDACHGCDQRFADRTDPIFAGPPQPLPVGVLCLDCLGLHVSHEPMAHAGSLHEREAPQMTAQRRQGRVKKSPIWGICLRRDNWTSVRYAEGLNSSKSSTTFQSTDRHDILGQKSASFQLSL